jgi:hypothetical protein
VDDPEGPTQAEALLVTGGFIGVALALLVQAQRSGAALAAQQDVGIILGLAAVLGLWWWMRRR